MSSTAYQALGTTWDGHDGRTRLLDATVELAASGGLRTLNVGAVTDAAGLTRRTFYRYFADVQGAFLAASLGLHSVLRDAIAEAYAAEAVPEQRAAACIDALLDLIADDPRRARVLFVEGPAGGPAIDDLRSETKEWLIGLLTARSRRARSSPVTDDDPVLGLLAEMAVGGIDAVIWRHLLHDDLDGLAAARSCLIEVALRPYRWQQHRGRTTAAGSSAEPPSCGLTVGDSARSS